MKHFLPNPLISFTRPSAFAQHGVVPPSVVMRKSYSSNIKKYNIFIVALGIFFSLSISKKTVAQVQQTFTSSGTFTVPANVTKITVECWGGGGNGGAPTSNGIAGGGGGGAYARKLVTVTPGNYTVTVGTSGLDSWFGTSLTVLAKGGSSVAGGSNLGASGGTAAGSIGDFVFSGGNGANSGANYSGGGGSSAGNLAIGNNASVSTNAGGAAPSGGGKGADGITKKGGGINGNTPGGGGSGAWRNGSAEIAGAGASGQVIITYYTLTGTSVATVCQNSSTTVTLNNSTTAILPVGTYTVTYNLSGNNTATGNTAALTVLTAGTGTFSTTTLANTGSTTVTITDLTSGIYSSSIGANNTATLNVGSATQPTISAGSSTIFCTGGSVVLTSSIATSYKWYQDGVLITGATSQTYTASTSAAYTVVTTNAAGCSSPVSAATDVTVNPLPATPTITAGGPTTFCADASLTLTSTPASTWQWYKGGVLISGATNQTYSPTTSGTYTVVVTNAFGCFSSASSGTAVVVNALPTSPTITAGGPTTFCSGASVVLTSAAATTYKWYDDNGIIAGATNQTYTASVSGSYIVRVTNSSGCVAVSSAQSVTVNPLPDIDIAPQTTSLCSSASSQTTSLAYTGTNNSPTSYSITWNAAAITAGFTNVTNVALPVTPISVTVPANVLANTYTGSLTVKNANGCESASKNFTVTVKSSPDVSNFSISAVDGCEGTGAVITVNSTSLGNGVYNVKYDLVGADNSIDNTATFTISGNTGTFIATAVNTGSTTITITEVSLVGCATPVLSNTATFTVNSLPPVPTISGPTKVCVDGTITLTGNPGLGTWQSSEPSIGTINNSGLVSGLIGGTTIITYTTPIDGNGCTNKNTKNITVNALPTVQGITGLTSYCVGTTSTLSNATPNGTWSSSDPSIATIDNTGLINAITIGTTVITYTTPTDASGCSNFTTINVVVNPDPTVVAGSDIDVCESSSPAAITLSGSSYSGGATSAFWTIENVGSGSLSPQGTGNNPDKIKYTPAANFFGTITLKLTTNIVGTCGSASATRLINITQKPTATPGAAITVCQNLAPSAITLVNALVGGSASTGTWSIISGGGILSDYTAVTDPANVSYTPASNFSGTVTLRLTTDAVGICGASFADRTINVTAIPTADAGTQNSICQSGTPGTFALAGASIGGGAINGAWSITLGTGTLSSIAPTATPAAVTFQPTANFTGTVKLTLKTNTPAGCGFETAERIIDVTAASTVSTGGPDQVCQSSAPVALTLSPSTVGGGATTGKWEIVSGGGTLSSTNPEINPASVTYTPDVNYTGAVSLLLTTNATGNCAAVSTSRAITVSPNATITLTSLAATTSQTPCINTAITDIKYSIGGGGAGATFSGLPNGVSGNYSGGVVTISGSPTVSGSFTYIVSTTAGTCSQTSATGTIDVSAASVGGSFSPSLIAVCSGATPTLTLSGTTGGLTGWQKSINAGATWSATTDVTTTIPYTVTTGVTQATLFRAIVKNGVCPAVNSSAVQVIIDAPFTPTVTAAPGATICFPNTATLTASGYTNNGQVITGGDFSSSNPPGWNGSSGANNSGDNNANWGISNNTATYNGQTYSSADFKYMITTGQTANGSPFQSNLTTPTFTLVGISAAYLALNQAYNLATTSSAKIQISINGGASYTDLQSNTGSGAAPGVIYGPTNGLAPTEYLNLNNYLGLSNLKIRFLYTGSPGSNWAIDNVFITNTNNGTNPTGVNVYNNVTYTWTAVAPASTASLSGTTGQSVTFTPPASGSFAYNVTTTTSAANCVSSVPGTITVTVNDPVAITSVPATTAFCVGGNTTITVGASGTSPTYQWQVSTTGVGGPWVDLTNTAPYSTVKTNSLTLTAPSINLSTNVYRVVVTGAAPCGFVNSTAISLQYNNVWMGGLSNLWTNPGNWSAGILPSTGCATVYIPNRANQPLLNGAATATITNILIDPSATLTVSNATLQIAGTITNNGTFDVTAGTIELNGTSGQTIPANVFKTNLINNLIISNGVSLGGALDLTGNLTFGSVSSKTFATGGFLTLKSSATNTAAVGPVINNFITGAVTVERYFSAKRAWRYLSVPNTATGQTIKSAWQENMPQGSTTPSTPAGYGTQVTDAIAPTVANGFDYFSPVGPSVKKYDPATNTYTGIANTAVPIATKEGWMTFVRGDRTAAGLYATPTVTILRTKGSLFIGDQSAVTVPASPLFTGIGNPYAAPLDMRNISKTSVPNFFTLWDPKLTTGLGFGAFQTFSLISGEYYPTPGSGSYPASGTAYNFIQSGLAFFVQGGASAGSVTFMESAKASAPSNNLVFRPSGGIQESLIRTNLYAVETSGEAALIDGTLNLFGDYSNKVDDLDGRKMTNNTENVAIKVDSQLLVVERRQVIGREDTIFLNMQKMRAKAYRFEFAGQKFDDLLTAFLEDSYLNTRVPLNINGSTPYDFTVENIPGSWNPSRFRIVFKSTRPLPITFTNISATKKYNDIQVDWAIERELAVKHYDVEKSTDGQNFTSAVMVNAKANDNSKANYQWLDAAAVTGDNFYRIKSTDIVGQIQYSNTVKVKLTRVAPQITVYPNPVADDRIILHLINQPVGTYHVRLFNAVGQLLSANILQHGVTSAAETLLMKKWPHGNYHLEIIKPDKSKTDIKIVY